ncbi:tigger transposable element-derived protein 2-like [Dysidea avara]|uniref:tigger transposable element-derived protein 2-like n=1 Tax=Dysidea avara TaxID=196820 RepID=UPI00332B79C2
MASKATWGIEEMKTAVDRVKKKEITLREAGKLYGIPKSTLSDHVTGKSSKAYAGAPRGLSDEDEVEIVITCQVLAEMGFPLNVYYVGTVIKDYLEQQGKQNPFGDTGMPGRDWWSRFLSRHSSLAQRRPQHLSKKRAQANDPIVLDEWFERVRKLFASSKLDKFESEAIAERLWNCDETGFCTAVASKQVLAKKGSKAVYEVGGGSGHCGSASGRRLPPFTVYKAKHMYDTWKQGGPPGAAYSVSSSGWMEGANFLSWFTKIFLKEVELLLQNGPVILFVDGHHSHINLELINVAREHKVHIMCLPPNLTHILQPMDVGVFRPLKQCYYNILKEYKMQTMAENESHIISGFRAAGLHPLNRSAIKDLKLATGVPFQQPAKEPRTATTIVQASSPIVLRGSCKSCGAELTPMRAHLTWHFTKILQKKHHEKSSKRKKRVKQTCYGEALTSDEIVARLEGECATTPPDKEPVCDDHDEASIVLYSQAGNFN